MGGEAVGSPQRRLPRPGPVIEPSDAPGPPTLDLPPDSPAPPPAPPPVPQVETAAADGTEGLTAAIGRGDEAAFERFYRAWFGAVCGMAAGLTGRDEAFCLDVAQETMLKAARAIPTLPTRAALSAWLERTAHRSALDLLRAERRRRARESSRGAAANDPVSDERIEWLRRRLAELPREDRELLGLRFFGAGSLRRVAAAMGGTEDAAHGRVRRVIRRLRAMWTEGGS